MSFDPGYATIEAFEVGSALTKIHSFTIIVSEIEFPKATWSVSPNTSRCFISTLYNFYIVDYQNSNILLRGTGPPKSHCFSSDGNFFAAFNEGVVRIWRYSSGRYILWKTFLGRSSFIYSPHFSPTASSILERIANTLQVWRLHDLPSSPNLPPNKYAGLAPSGNYIATAHKSGRTVTIVGIRSQFSQFIDAGVTIMGLFLTDNVLLVNGPNMIVTWLLTGEGWVDSVFGNKRASRGDSIWEVSKYILPNLMVDAGSRVGEIRGCLGPGLLHAYHTETGEVLQSTHPLHPIYGRPLDLLGAFRGRDYDAID